MATSVFKTAIFGQGKSDLLTVGYRLYNADFTAAGSRTISGVEEVSPGTYGALISIPNDRKAIIKWYNKIMPKLKLIHKNEVFGRLTVIGEPIRRKYGQSGKSHIVYECQCACGNRTLSLAHGLRAGTVISCGCYQKERVVATHVTHGQSKSRLYNIWVGMLQRCMNPNSPSFHRYGGRGLQVDSSWVRSFSTFQSWALTHGYKENLEIDRIDNNAGYEPDNCRWVTRVENANNTSKAYKITMFGETKSLSAWLRDSRSKAGTWTVRARLKAGWAPVKALLTPPTRGFRSK